MARNENQHWIKEGNGLHSFWIKQDLLYLHTASKHSFAISLDFQHNIFADCFVDRIILEVECFLHLNASFELEFFHEIHIN